MQGHRLPATTATKASRPPDVLPTPRSVSFGRCQLDGRGLEAAGDYSTELPQIAVYNLTPPKGVAADFGYKAGALFIGHIYQTLDSSPRLRRALDRAVHHGHHSGPRRRADDLGRPRRSGARFRTAPSRPKKRTPIRLNRTKPQKTKPPKRFSVPTLPRRTARCSTCRWTAASTTARSYSPPTPGPTPTNSPPASGHHRRRQRHGLRRRAGPVQPGDQPAADRPGCRGPPTGLDVHLEVEQREPSPYKTRICSIRKTISCTASTPHR